MQVAIIVVMAVRDGILKRGISLPRKFHSKFHAKGLPRAVVLDAAG
jgi:hypothetical protein